MTIQDQLTARTTETLKATAELVEKAFDFQIGLLTSARKVSVDAINGLVPVAKKAPAKKAAATSA